MHTKGTNVRVCQYVHDVTQNVVTSQLYYLIHVYVPHCKGTKFYIPTMDLLYNVLRENNFAN